MTPEQLKAIRYRLRQATKSHKWFTDGSKVCVEWYKGNSPVLAETFVPAWHEDRQMGLLEAAHNAEFIANAPNDIDALLDEVERLQPHNLVAQVDELLKLGVGMRRDIERLRGALGEAIELLKRLRDPQIDETGTAWIDEFIARQALAGESV